MTYDESITNEQRLKIAKEVWNDFDKGYHEVLRRAVDKAVPEARGEWAGDTMASLDAEAERILRDLIENAVGEAI